MYARVSQVVPSLQILQPEFCTHFPSHSCILYASSIPSSLIWPPSKYYEVSHYVIISILQLLPPRSKNIPQYCTFKHPQYVLPLRWLTKLHIHTKQVKNFPTISTKFCQWSLTHSQLNPVYNLNYFSKIHFNFILLSTPSQQKLCMYVCSIHAIITCFLP